MGGRRDRDERNEYMREYRKKNPLRFRNYVLKSRFKITAEEYEKLLLDQNGQCAICSKAETANCNWTSKTRMLAIDHCHVTGKIRGLLCGKCNTGLGLLNDSETLLENALKYIRK
jgi:hypothetical protein